MDKAFVHGAQRSSHRARSPFPHCWPHITMSSTSGPDTLEGLLTRLTLFRRPSTPCHARLPDVHPSVDEILPTLSPTDADVFRSVLAGVPLISQTPAFAKRHPLETPADVNAHPFLATLHAQMVQSYLAMNATHVRYAREHPVLFFADPEFSRLSGLMLEPGIDDMHYAARAALRLTVEELDDKMQLSAKACINTTWEMFKPLVSYRHACATALSPLIDLGPPPADVLRGYAWTWRTCVGCARHVERGACGMFCADAPWFVALWRELVTILRARPDPDAVLIHGHQHFLQALQDAMACPTCSKVAAEHLRCFQGLLVVEAAKRIAEVPFVL